MKYFFIVLVFLFLLFTHSTLADSDSDILIKQIKDKEVEIKKLETEEAAYRQTLSEKQSQSNTLKSQISQIKTQIKRLKADLNVAKAKISKTESNIKLHSSEIRKKEIEIKNRESAMAESIRFLARIEKQNAIVLLLKNNKFSDFLSSTQYLTSFETGLYNNFKTLTQNKIELEDMVSEEKNLRDDLNILKKDLLIKDLLIQNQKREKNQLLSKTKNQEKEYQKIISQLQIRQAEIQKEIFELEDRLRGEVTGVPPPRPGALTWPLLGRITQGYGPTSITGFYNDVYKFHNGIDIAAYYGAPVRASLDGVVAASGSNSSYAYGDWLAIRHNNGLTTLYAHLSAKIVSVGENVSQGQLIGYEGSSGFVTGPHLHFTVYSTNTFKIERRWFGLLPIGGSVNPFDYLLK